MSQGPAILYTRHDINQDSPIHDITKDGRQNTKGTFKFPSFLLSCCLSLVSARQCTPKR